MENESISRAIQTQKYKHDTNFWDEYPDFLALRAFLEFKDGMNKTYGSDKHSSKIMWSLYLIYHPKSIFAGQPIDVRINFVEKDFLNKPGFFAGTEALNNIIETYKQLTVDAIEYYVFALKNKLYEREKLIAETPYDKTNAKFIDEIILNSDKVLTEIEKAEARLQQKTEREVRGKQKLSLLAKRRLIVSQKNYNNDEVESSDQSVTEEVSK